MPSFSTLSSAIALVLLAGKVTPAFTPVRDYSGQSFFSHWNFYDDWDQPTFGDVQYLGQQAATQQRLAYVNDAGNAIIRVDNFTNVVWDNKRNSVRLESKDFFRVGTIWIMDALHMPYGCSVWPSWWTKAQNGWPLTGEIDIVEYVNLMTANQMAIHSSETCKVPGNQKDLQSGQPLLTSNCTADGGCTVGETKQNSLGPGFAAAGGGVYAAQFDTSGVYIWFWSRPDVPQSIKQSTATSNIDITDWGRPSAAWPATDCNVEDLFDPQQMIITITLCGKWANANNGSVYRETCQGLCYNDNVLGNGTNYNNAYFEIPFIRAYSPEGQNTIVQNSTSPSGSASGSGNGPSPTGSASPGSNNSANTLDVLATRGAVLAIVIGGVLASML